MRLQDEMRLELIVLCGVLCVCGGGDVPPGHLKPLGSHREPQLVARLTSVPASRDFFYDYVEPNTPVLLEGLLNSTHLLKNWGSDGYALLSSLVQVQL